MGTVARGHDNDNVVKHCNHGVQCRESMQGKVPLAWKSRTQCREPMPGKVPLHGKVARNAGKATSYAGSPARMEQLLQLLLQLHGLLSCSATSHRQQDP